MIKPYINSEYVSGTDKECKQAIDRANMVILFGVSLGATDRMWWNYLDEQVAAYPKRIIYCPYEEDTSALDMSEVIIRNNGHITRCANNMYLSSNEYDHQYSVGEHLYDHSGKRYDQICGEGLSLPF